MTIGEKDLLFKDLCARLPYGVIVNVKGFDYDYNDKLTQIYNGYGCSIQVTTNMPYDIEQVKPYLFPLSSMTSEQYDEFFKYFHNIEIEEIKASDDYLKAAYLGDSAKYEWLNRNYFDWRFLIDKGLAIDCTNLDIY